MRRLNATELLHRIPYTTLSRSHKTTETYRPGARTMPGRYYTSSEVFAEEAERIFRRRWICVGRTKAIPEPGRSEEHTSELQSHSDIVCRLLLEKKKSS